MNRLFLLLFACSCLYIHSLCHAQENFNFNSLERCKEPFFELSENFNQMFAQQSLHQMMCVRDLNLVDGFEIHIVDDGWFDEIETKELAKILLTPTHPMDILLGLGQSSFSKLNQRTNTKTAAYYQPKDNQLFLRGRLEEKNPELFYKTLYHELVHVLQYKSLEEQDLNILTTPFLFTALRKNWGEDGTLAVLSLIEGDAEFSTALAFSKPEPFIQTLLPDIKPASIDNYLHSESESTLIPDIPDWVNSRMFPYIKGAQFVKKIWESNAQSWQKINRMYTFPPISTELILHPERYIQNEESIVPLEIEPTPIINALNLNSDEYTFQLQQHRTAGELGWIQRLLINNDLPFSQIETAAEGWGGDIEILFEKRSLFTYPDFFTNKKHSFLLSKTVWDTSNDAIEFFQAWQNRKSTFSQVSLYKPEEKAVYILISEDISFLELNTISQKL